MEDSIRKNMKMDVNLASKDPLKFIDSVLAHHKSQNRDMIIREDSDDEEDEWNFLIWSLNEHSKKYYTNVNKI